MNISSFKHLFFAEHNFRDQCVPKIKARPITWLGILDFISLGSIILPFIIPNISTNMIDRNTIYRIFFALFQILQIPFWIRLVNNFYNTRQYLLQLQNACIIQQNDIETIRKIKQYLVMSIYDAPAVLVSFISISRDIALYICSTSFLVAHYRGLHFYFTGSILGFKILSFMLYIATYRTFLRKSSISNLDIQISFLSSIYRYAIATIAFIFLSILFCIPGTATQFLFMPIFIAFNIILLSYFVDSPDKTQDKKRYDIIGFLFISCAKECQSIISDVFLCMSLSCKHIYTKIKKHFQQYKNDIKMHDIDDGNIFYLFLLFYSYILFSILTYITITTVLIFLHLSNIRGISGITLIKTLAISSWFDILVHINGILCLIGIIFGPYMIDEKNRSRIFFCSISDNEMMHCAVNITSSHIRAATFFLLSFRICFIWLAILVCIFMEYNGFFILSHINLDLQSIVEVGSFFHPRGASLFLAHNKELSNFTNEIRSHHENIKAVHDKISKLYSNDETSSWAVKWQMWNTVTNATTSEETKAQHKVLSKEILDIQQQIENACKAFFDKIETNKNNLISSQYNQIRNQYYSLFSHLTTFDISIVLSSLAVYLCFSYVVSFITMAYLGIHTVKGDTKNIWPIQVFYFLQ